MTTQDIDRIQSAIDHIKTAVDVDEWAAEIAVDAMEKQIPKPVKITTSTKRCGNCGRQLSRMGNIHNIHPERNYCVKCGQKVGWDE